MRLGLEAGVHSHDIAVQLGISGVTIGADELVARGGAVVAAGLDQLGLALCQVSAFGYNPLHPDPAYREKQTHLLIQSIPEAAAAGCRHIVISGGNYHPNGFGGHDARTHRPAALTIIAMALGPLLERAERHGVLLSIEPYLKAAVSGASQFLALHEMLGSKALKVNIDVTSLYNYAEFIDPSPLVRRTCRALAGHYGLLHVKELALGEGFHLNASLAPLGTGPTDWSLVLAETAPHLPDHSWLVLEHVSDLREATASLAILRAAAVQAGVSFT